MFSWWIVGAVIRTEDYFAVSGIARYATVHNGDYPLSLGLLTKGDALYVSKPLVNYRIWGEEEGKSDGKRQAVILEDMIRILACIKSDPPVQSLCIGSGWSLGRIRRRFIWLTLLWINLLPSQQRALGRRKKADPPMASPACFGAHNARHLHGSPVLAAENLSLRLTPLRGSETKKTNSGHSPQKCNPWSPSSSPYSTRKKSISAAASRARWPKPHPQLEIIVSDNHSTNGCAEFLSGLADPRLRLIKPPCHLQLIQHFAFAGFHANGQLLSFLPSDDWLEADWLDVMAGVLEKHPDAAFAFCDLRKHEVESGQVSRYRGDAYPSRYLTNTEAIRHFRKIHLQGHQRLHDRRPDT